MKFAIPDDTVTPADVRPMVHTPVVGYPVLGDRGVTVLLNGESVVVDQEHRRYYGDYPVGVPEAPGEGEPVVLTVSAPITLTLEDVAAVLVGSYCTYEDLADDQFVRWLVAETVVNVGCCGLDERRLGLAGARGLTEDEALFLAYCRQRAVAVFGACPATTSSLSFKLPHPTIVVRRPVTEDDHFRRSRLHLRGTDAAC